MAGTVCLNALPKQWFTFGVMHANVCVDGRQGLADPTVRISGMTVAETESLGPGGYVQSTSCQCLRQSSASSAIICLRSRVFNLLMLGNGKASLDTTCFEASVV